MLSSHCDSCKLLSSCLSHPLCKHRHTHTHQHPWVLAGAWICATDRKKWKIFFPGFRLRWLTFLEPSISNLWSKWAVKFTQSCICVRVVGYRKKFCFSLSLQLNVWTDAKAIYSHPIHKQDICPCWPFCLPDLSSNLINSLDNVISPVLRGSVS